MACFRSNHQIGDTAEALEVIREEQCSPALSVNMNNTNAPDNIETKRKLCSKCKCKKDSILDIQNKIDLDETERLLQEKEQQLREECKEQLEKETESLKEKFDLILQNEQVRASYMLREAYRERQEKIQALMTQLECKNLAGLMYVMCAERRKSKLERLKLIEDYTNFINVLQDILGEAQALILHLSRGHKTAARVDHEWRQKMINIIKEFQCFIHNFSGGTPESIQYFFDLPTLLKTETAIVDNPEEDPCEEEEIKEIEEPVEKPWWERLDGDCRPFLVFGDMADFKPPQRREVLRTIKATKTAPRKWKEYVFNEMLLKSGCPNADQIKDEYPQRLPTPGKWVCHAVQTSDDSPDRMSDISRRMTTASVDLRGNMGSILKMITASALSQPSRATGLLGVRDSMEIASTTKLRERHKSECHDSQVVLNIGNRKVSLFNEIKAGDVSDDDDDDVLREPTVITKDNHNDDSVPILGQAPNDSLMMIGTHKPDHDHKVHYEKICPLDSCQRMQVDSFTRSLPAYMRTNPFMHYEQTFDNYEPCSPEQLEILRQRIEDKKKKEKDHVHTEENPLAEWTPSVEGIAVQTSDMSISLPPCTCRAPRPTPASSTAGFVFDIQDLIPMKQTLDKIKQECFYDDRIEFDRFKVIGQESNSTIEPELNKANFTRSRLQEIRKILKKHPSLCDLFQANTKCYNRDI